MENPKNQLATKLKDAQNVLVTVSNNPSVDQLAAAIGLTLLLGKLKKHATTVFSGQVPSTIEFLKPEETIESNTDSLRDFIIALDKAKADKLRYKVEDTMVKIFITPYRTSIGEADLEFSQGDFNVDVVIGLGVHNREDLDQAITEHGRILHDATVATINTKDNGSDVGNPNWVDNNASSLCEMVVALSDMLKTNSLDAQMATALLTGIVAETERFSNEKTTSTTMSASAKLMAAGANQQLVATKLESVLPSQPVDDADKPVGDSDKPSEPSASQDDDGSLRINHDQDSKPPEPPKDSDGQDNPPENPEPPKPPDTNPDNQPPAPELPPPAEDQNQSDALQPGPDDKLTVRPLHRDFLDTPPRSQQAEMEDELKGKEDNKPASNIMFEPPALGGALNAAADNFNPDKSTLGPDTNHSPILSHNSDDTKKSDDHDDHHDLPPPPPLPDPWSQPSPKDDHAQPQQPEPSLPPPAPEPPRPEPIKAPQPKPAPPPLPPPVPAPTEPPLPKAVIDVMDDHTLKDIEKAVDSPHRKALGSQFPQKTLSSLEETFDSPHAHAPELQAPVLPAAPQAPPVMPPAFDKPADKKPDTGLALDYEAHESEPPQKGAGTLGAPDVSEVPVFTLPDMPAHHAPPLPPVKEPEVPQKADKPAMPDLPVASEPAAPPASEPSDLEHDTDKIRGEIEAALAADTSAPRNPIDALNAQPLGDTITHESVPAAPADDSATPPPAEHTPIHIDADGNFFAGDNDASVAPATNPLMPPVGTDAPPSSPPPMMPPMPAPAVNNDSK